MSEKQQAMHPSRTPNRTPHRKGKMAAWPFSRLWSVSDPTLFQMTLVAALLATVHGKCGPPPNLQFAALAHDVRQTEFQTGAILRYTCRPGYSRTSSSSIVTCKSNGQWDYSYFCVKKRCSHPGDLLNGQVKIKTDLYFGSQIEFSCSEGFILIGSTTSHCEVQGKGVEWSDPFPVCIIGECRSPPEIRNGKVIGGDEDVYTYGSLVTYMCDPQFTLRGNASIYCTLENKTGVWRPSPPTCEKIICPTPDVLHGNIVSGFRSIYSYKDFVMFDCQEGYTLRGRSITVCEADNNWNPSLPTCEPNSCVGLPNISHASWELTYWQTRKTLFRVDTVLRYRCHEGYQPATNEPTTVTCQRNYRWSPFKGCKEVCCPTPELMNGRITSLKKKHTDSGCAYFYEDVLSYTCNNKKEVLSAMCQSDGTWGPQRPFCDQSCNLPPIVAHGHHKVSSYGVLQTEIKYECDEGYQMVGQATLSCRFSQWSSAAPQCKALCLKPEIKHGKLSLNKAQYVESENITIHCDSGFGVVGPQSIMCSENRTWYPKVPKCAWEVPEGCEKVFASRKLMQCLPSPEEVKTALEVYKLSLEIELLELQRDKARKLIPASSL